MNYVFLTNFFVFKEIMALGTNLPAMIKDMAKLNLKQD